MSEWKEGYKVLAAVNKQLMSWSHVAINECDGMRWFTNKINKRKKGWGPLAVFDKLEHAIDFIKHYGSNKFKYSLYSCEYKESRVTGKLWCRGPNGLCNYFCNIYGTGYADEVKLKKRLNV